jgi:hypothetical protein
MKLLEKSLLDFVVGVDSQRAMEDPVFTSMKESIIEGACREWAWKEHGIISFKMGYRVGVPDRVFLKNSEAMFVEFKVPGQVPRSAQKWQQKQLIKEGFLVVNINSLRQFKEVIEAWLNL